MSSTKRSGKNTTFTFQNQVIGQIVDIIGPNQTKTQIDCTTLDSPGSYREFIGGLRDGGQLDLTLILNPSSSTDNLLRSNFELNSDEAKVCSINLAGSGTTLNFSGSVFAMSHAIPLDDYISMDCTIRVSSPIIVSGSAWS